MTKNKVVICTFLALTSGLVGGYISGQITSIIHSQKCQNQGWVLKEVCNALVTPGAIWQGSTTGLWTGTVLGAFAGGLVTRQSRN